ncbi:uncharacterized protein LOC114546991 isoform X2 [Perca flavescens]|uniref:uncharacterized protein LOC114546991 isoform X2 n=1 Tax=Perca flavescens TaxID=8167 RepID=UPI00106E136B|nr:uncharacterized protein LOC114546991 isoform X2 [Perca flavescens]
MAHEKRTKQDDSYKELVSKKNFFLLGKDIWAEEESRGVRMKKKMCETDVVKPKTLTDVNTGHGMAPGMNEIMSSLHDLPEMIKLMRECVECVRALMSSFRGTPSSAASSSSVDSEIEMHPLAGSTVTVSKRAFLLLNRSRMTIFAQELAVLVFTKEGLAQSTLTGKSGRGGAPKTQLDVDKVQAITDAVLLEFPQTMCAIRRKCNNEQFSQKKEHNVWCVLLYGGRG